jgi:hypothetical protein
MVTVVTAVILVFSNGDWVRYELGKSSLDACKAAIGWKRTSADRDQSSPSKKNPTFVSFCETKQVLAK